MFAFIEAQVDVRPHDLPLAVAPPAAADNAEGALAAASPGAFAVTAVPDAAAAERAIRDREAYGALVAGTGRPVVLVAGANGQVATQAASGALAAAARATGAATPRLVDLVPPPPGDPRALALNFLVLPLVIVGIISAAILRQTVPELGIRSRLPVLAGVAVAGGLLAVLVAGPLLDALPGPLLTEAGLVALAILGIAGFTAALLELIGPAAIGIAFLVLLIVGNIGSGLGAAPEFLPGFWRTLGPWLPPGALGDALRGVAYFDGAGLLRPVLVLVAWAAAGVGAALVLARREAVGG